MDIFKYRFTIRNVICAFQLLEICPSTNIYFQAWITSSAHQYLLIDNISLTAIHLCRNLANLTSPRHHHEVYVSHCFRKIAFPSSRSPLLTSGAATPISDQVKPFLAKVKWHLNIFTSYTEYLLGFSELNSFRFPTLGY